MYLKSVELQGFKSFPDKLLVNFDKGVTCIVGPNGSGKSNIVDAVRWVLGEQSAKSLRGGKMEDVIFGGSAKRSAQGFCQVSLTVDNSDGTLQVEYPEITVTRRYYRSGESEFYINKKSVRLKDVHEMFMDTGLGRDGYSIIGQGRIDEILSVKGSERRDIFDEAAGISRFRYRKEEAERKLSECEENLLRVKDIISELENQVGPLKEQAEKAKSFLLLRDELRVLEVSLWLDSLDKLKDGINRARTDYDNACRMLDARKRELNESYASQERLDLEMREAELQMEKAREALLQAEGAAKEARSQIALCRVNIENHEENIRVKSLELSEQNRRLETLNLQKEERQQLIRQLTEEYEGLGKNLQALTEEIEKAAGSALSLTERVDGLTARLNLLNDELAENGTKKAALLSGTEQLKTRGSAAHAETSQAEDRLKQEEYKATELAQEIMENEEKKTSSENMLKGFAMRTQTRQAKVRDLEKAANDTLRLLTQKTDRLAMLQIMQREYEGFSHAVKQVMRAAGSGGLKGVHGPVSSLIHTDRAYSVAIEIALGAGVQNIVVDTEQSAKAAIGYLKANDFGRATFLPLVTVKDKNGSHRSLKGESGFQGYASELLECDNVYRELINSLLGSVAVVDHIDSAIALARKYGYAFRIVTLDGQLISPSGAMTGGSLNQKGGILSRSAEAEALKEAVAKLEKQAKDQDDKLAEAKRELEAAEYDANVAGDSLRLAQDALLGLSAKQEQHQLLMDALKEQIARLNQEQSEQERTAQSMASEIQSLEMQEEKKRAEAEQIKQQLVILAGGKQQAEVSKGELSERTSALRVNMAACEAKRKAAVDGVAELCQLIEMTGGDKAGRGQEISRLTEQIEQIKTEINEHETAVSDWMQKAQEARTQVSALSEQKLQKDMERAKNQRDIQAKNNELMGLERECSRLENKKTQSEMEETTILDRMWESYELTRATAAVVRIEIPSVSKASRRAGELKSAIKQLGDVNISAIDEYDRVGKRYQFLVSQRDDIEKAKEDLCQVINELVEGMKEQFIRQFNKINNSFGETFTEIFGGGSASLSLDDERDVLQSGIEIQVALPGKSVRTISLLSGGERTFVAIALYFAMIKVSPVPFCFMDEIDTALDEMNVLRFAQYMRKLREMTQFIVITHRRGTMESSDMLYGATMQEQGVTKLLALNLSEAEQKILVKKESR